MRLGKTRIYDIFLGIFMMLIINGISYAAPVGVPVEVIYNGGFETGDFTGWTVVNPHDDTPYPWYVALPYPFVFRVYTDVTPVGNHMAVNGFDNPSDVPGSSEFRIYQDVYIPAGTATLSWKDSMGWVTFGGLPVPRTFMAQICDPATDSILLTAYSDSVPFEGSFWDYFNSGGQLFTAPPLQQHTVDLSDYAGSTVRLCFVEIMPEAYTGPGHFEIDDISLKVEPPINVAPEVDAGPGATIDEGDTFTGSGSFTDPDADTWSATVDYGDGSGTQLLDLTGNTFSLSHTYADNGEYIVIVTVADDDDGIGSDTATVTVNNVAPIVEAITGMEGPVAVNTLVTMSATFIDPGIPDTHSATWSWGDGTETSLPLGTVTSPVSCSHTYTAAAIYTVTLTVTDNDGGSDIESYQYVVVYDKSAGFVTGGGWIDSPASAYMPDETLSGKATFEFDSKYKKGATVPIGNTEFQIADLNFESTSYDWLVIDSSNAMYKGVGTINGEGEYSFMLSAIDSDDGDKFRMKIWNNDGVIYDNQPGEPDNADASIAIAGGSIVIHNYK